MSASDERPSLRRHLLGGAITALLLTVGLGGWAATTELAGAVIAPGSIVVDSNVKKVQHLTGGIVGELLVRDGQHVRGGEVVLRLDDTITRTNLAIVTKGLDEMIARRARLASERDRLEEVAFPAEFLARAIEPDVAAVIDSERKLFELRFSARLGQKSQLKERIAQLAEEIRGYVALQEAKSEEIELIQRELEGVRGLWNKNLVQINRLISLEREAARLKGERAQSIAAMAQSRGKIGEIELQIIQIDQDLSSEVARELREVEGKIGEFIERKVAAEDQLKRVEIRAPAGRGGASAGGAHGRRGRPCPRPHHADRAGSRCAVGRGEGLAAGYRPAACRPGHRAALFSLQPAYDTGDQRGDQPHLGRRLSRRDVGAELLHHSNRHRPGGDRPAGQC